MRTSSLAGAAGDAADGATHRFVRRLSHGDLEDAHEDVGAEGTGAVEGRAYFGPVLLRAPSAVEGLPDLLEEELGEELGDVIDFAAQFLGGGENGVGAHADF